MSALIQKLHRIREPYVLKIYISYHRIFYFLSLPPTFKYMSFRVSAAALVLLSFSYISCKREKVKEVTSSEIFNSYCTDQQAAFFNVPPSMVSMFLDESKKGNKELKDLLIDVRELSFLIINRQINTQKECLFYYEINGRLDSINFYDIAQINTGKEIIRVKVDKERRHFNEFVVMVSKTNALYCISFKGRIPSKKVINLVKPENVVAVTNLDRFNL